MLRDEQVNMKLETFLLERINVVVKKFLSGHALQSIRLERRNLVDDIILRLSTELLGEVTGVTEKGIEVAFEKEVSIKRFASWWDHFKQSNFPEFLIRWFPVRYDTKSQTVHGSRYVHVKLLEMYPKLPNAYPECGDSFPHIAYMITGCATPVRKSSAECKAPKIEITINNG